MMKIHKSQKIVCVCRGGQVRSVACRYLLNDYFGFRKVLTCSWEKNDAETLHMLYEWADIILVVGRGSEWNLSTPLEKTILLEVGQDVYGHYQHPDLLRLLHSKLEEIL